VGIDNRCSGCISHVREDFIGLLQPTRRVIKGFGGSRMMNVSIGTLRWSWEDDQGRHHAFDIPNSYYVPDGHIRLLSPQHWAKRIQRIAQSAPSEASTPTATSVYYIGHTEPTNDTSHWGATIMSQQSPFLQAINSLRHSVVKPVWMMTVPTQWSCPANS
jgi:hypothetical protein